MRDARASDRLIPSDGPRALPYCVYHRARDVTIHGLQALPGSKVTGQGRHKRYQTP